MTCEIRLVIIGGDETRMRRGRQFQNGTHFHIGCICHFTWCPAERRVTCPPMTDPDETAFFNFMDTERSASPRTMANYRDALAAYRTWRADRFTSWREAEADEFRDYLFALMKQGFKRATIRLRFAALRSFYKYLVLRSGLGRSPVAEVQLPETGTQPARGAHHRADRRAVRNPAETRSG